MFHYSPLLWFAATRQAPAGCSLHINTPHLYHQSYPSNGSQMILSERAAGRRASGDRRRDWRQLCFSLKTLESIGDGQPNVFSVGFWAKRIIFSWRVNKVEARARQLKGNGFQTIPSARAGPKRKRRQFRSSRAFIFSHFVQSILSRCQLIGKRPTSIIVFRKAIAGSACSNPSC